MSRRNPHLTPDFADKVRRDPGVHPHVSPADVAAAGDADPTHAAVFYRAARYLADHRNPSGPHAGLHRRLAAPNLNGRPRVAKHLRDAVQAIELDNDHTALAALTGTNPHLAAELWDLFDEAERRRFTALLHMQHPANAANRRQVADQWNRVAADRTRSQNDQARRRIPAKQPRAPMEQVKDAAAFATVLAAGAAGFVYQAGAHEQVTTGIATVLVADGLWRATRRVCSTRNRGLFAPGQIVKDYARTVGATLRRAARFTANTARAAARATHRTQSSAEQVPRRVQTRRARRDGTALTRGTYAA